MLMGKAAHADKNGGNGVVVIGTDATTITSFNHEMEKNRHTPVNNIVLCKDKTKTKALSITGE